MREEREASSIDTAIARPGETCWRVERARRFSLLVDNESYFAAVAAALERARRSVFLLGWQFDPRTALRRSPNGSLHDTIGEVLGAIAKARPELEVRLLIWDMPLPISATLDFFPQRARRWFRGRVHFRLDKCHPAGACHHQKLVVVDDRLAFCSGGDFGANRWDSAEHLDHDARRRLPSGRPHRPRHALTAVCDGAAAAALGDIARARWERATDERLPPCRPGEGDPWPDGLASHFTDCDVAIARTAPADGHEPAQRENEALHLAAIAAARRLIYLENQYFTATRVAEALEARLAERDGPEIAVVLPGESPNYFDRLTMDAPRDALLARLRAADRHGRLRVLSPVTEGGTPIVVHSKVAVIDDRLIRVGSANLSNRSFGFDTECDVAIDAALSPAARPAIAAWADRLLSHQRLRPLEAHPGRVARLLARFQPGDPYGPEDSFRPWQRAAARAAR